MPDNFNYPPSSPNPEPAPMPVPPPATTMPVQPPTMPIPPIPESKPPKTKKIALIALSLFFILATLPAAILLTKQRQDVRKQAATDTTLTCRTWSGGNYSTYPNWFDALNRANAVIYKIHYEGDVTEIIGWKHVYKCDYSKVVQKYGPDNLACRDEDADAYIAPKQSEAIYNATGGNYTPELSEMIVSSHYDGQCQVIQVDVTPCGDGQPFYQIYANDQCPATTPTPNATVTPTVITTPTITPAATPTITLTPAPLACLSLINGDNPSSKKAGETIPLTCRGSSDAISPITRFEFRVSIDDSTPTALPNATAQTTTPTGNYLGTINYVIPTPGYGCYNFECRACNAIKCTVWGQAE